MVYSSFSLTVATLSVGLLACAGNEAPSATQSSATIAFSSEELAEAMAKVPQAAVNANFKTIGAMSFTQFFDQIAVPSAGAAFSVDGKVIANGLADLTAKRAAFVAADKAYPTIGAYWQAVGVQVDASPSLSSIQARIQAAVGASVPSLALASPNAYPDYMIKPGTSPGTPCYNAVTSLFGKGGKLEGADMGDVEQLMDKTALGLMAGTPTSYGFNHVQPEGGISFLANSIEAKMGKYGPVFFLWRFKNAGESFKIPPRIPPDETLNTCYYDRNNPSSGAPEAAPAAS